MKIELNNYQVEILSYLVDSALTGPLSSRITDRIALADVKRQLDADVPRETSEPK